MKTLLSLESLPRIRSPRSYCRFQQFALHFCHVCPSFFSGQKICGKLPILMGKRDGFLWIFRAPPSYMEPQHLPPDGCSMDWLENLQKPYLSMAHMGKIPWNSRFPCRLNPLRCGCSSGWGSAEGRERSWAEVNISCDIHVANILPNILAYITYINISIYIYVYIIFTCI